MNQEYLNAVQSYLAQKAAIQTELQEYVTMQQELSKIKGLIGELKTNLTINLSNSIFSNPEFGLALDGLDLSIRVHRIRKGVNADLTKADELNASVEEEQVRLQGIIKELQADIASLEATLNAAYRSGNYDYIDYVG